LPLFRVAGINAIGGQPKPSRWQPQKAGVDMCDQKAMHQFMALYNLQLLPGSDQPRRRLCSDDLPRCAATARASLRNLKPDARPLPVRQRQKIQEVLRSSTGPCVHRLNWHHWLEPTRQPDRINLMNEIENDSSRIGAESKHISGLAPAKQERFCEVTKASRGSERHIWIRS